LTIIGTHYQNLLTREGFEWSIRCARPAAGRFNPETFSLWSRVEGGYLTASLLQDAPVNLETAAGLYVPQNYDRDFKGWVSVRTALASSLNIPAVRTLILDYQVLTA
jgi:penicillin-binding protein 1C